MSEDGSGFEARLLVACFEEPEILAQLDELEIDDFADFRNQAAFTELRSLQALKQPINGPAIDARLCRWDAMKGSQVAEKAGIVYLSGLMVVTAPYHADVDAARADAKLLRLLRDQRASAAASTLVTDGAPAPENDEAFSTMPSRVRGELARRQYRAARAINYHNTFIDDVLRAILPHDLILIGAESGLGKTDLALSIAVANAMKERHVAYFALEAEPDELEVRMKYSWLSREAHRRRLPERDELNFTDWILCRCEHIVGALNDECDHWFLNHLGGLWTFYRGNKFDQDDLRRRILEIHKSVDLIIIDHLHYVDMDDSDSETRAIGETMKAIRDVSLRVGKPAILVAHLRKRDERLKKIVPGKDDFHGSSNIVKICTQAITMAPAHKVKPPKWWLAPTYIRIVKDRRAGAPPYVALQMFDRRTRIYEEDYQLGRLIKGDTDWEPVPPGDQPSWARCARQLELEFV